MDVKVTNMISTGKNPRYLVSTGIHARFVLIYITMFDHMMTCQLLLFYRLGPLSGPSLGLLEAEMTRVFGLGFSWPDAYTQCVFQTLIYTIQHR